MPKEQKEWEKELIEELADIEHQRWADWQKYVFFKCQRINGGVLTIPEELVKRWDRQISTSYSKLSDEEKESDRKEVMRYFPLIKSLLIEKEKEILQVIEDSKIDMTKIENFMTVVMYEDFVVEDVPKIINDVVDNILLKLKNIMK